MGIKRTDLTRPIDIWNLKSVKRQIFWRKMQKLKFHYFTIVHFGNSLVKIKCQIYVPKSSWNDPKSILSIKVCTITTFFKYYIEKLNFLKNWHALVPRGTIYILVASTCKGCGATWYHQWCHLFTWPADYTTAFGPVDYNRFLKTKLLDRYN